MKPFSEGAPSQKEAGNEVNCVTPNKEGSQSHRYESYVMQTGERPAAHRQSKTFTVGGTRSIIRLPNGSLLAVYSRPNAGGTAIFCTHSSDRGRTWADLGQIAQDAQPETDMGDGALVRSRTGDLFYAYRHNHYRGKQATAPDYAIRVSVSRDNGSHWNAYSTVTSHTLPEKRGPSQGLWAPFLFEAPDGRLQCYYDDEKTPLDAGFPGHQWLMMRTWEPSTKTWERPVVVSRAHDPKHLSRDGMGTVVALSKNRLLCPLESVEVMPPHANLVRAVFSDDGGKTWSWQRGERAVLYSPQKTDFMALSPYLTRLSDGTVLCIFCTDEDRDLPNRSGTPPHLLTMDVKVVRSRDAAKTWSRSETISTSHRAYLPGIVETRRGELLAVWMDFVAGKTLGKYADGDGTSPV